ncbi:MAG: alanine:cation symporter family protein, partial [Planctomycetes bacterium]|nr:alanine:cation symporter family protein [Planctomycetota bacterium]
DTLLICTITGITILSTGVLVTHQDLTGAQLTQAAFEVGFGNYHWIGNAIITTSVFFFAYSTMISWSYYGDRASEYLFGSKAIKPYRFVYVFFNFLGCILPLAVVWNIGDVALSCMAIPNLIAIIFLSGVLKKMTDVYFAKKHVTYKELIAMQQNDKSK